MTTTMVWTPAMRCMNTAIPKRTVIGRDIILRIITMISPLKTNRRWALIPRIMLQINPEHPTLLCIDI